MSEVNNVLRQLHANQAGIQKIGEDFIRAHGGDRPEIACVYWAILLEHVLRAFGYDAIVQAGTANFKYRNVPVPDDGKPTHYSYECDSDFHIQGMMREVTAQDIEEHGFVMPELYAWVVIRNHWIVVDWTTQYLEMLAARAGMVWELEKPPKFLVSPADKLPEGWRYLAQRGATMFVLAGSLEFKRREVFKINKL
jgi:hypothetical protein